MNKKDIAESAGKALVSDIPYLGGPISSLLGDFQNQRKEERFIEFLKGIENDLKGLEHHINDDFVSKADFIDIFEDVSKKIVSTRQDEKREAYRHILTNAMLSNDISYDEVEDFLKLVDSLRVEHIFILKILRDPITYDKTTGNKVGNGGGLFTSINQIMRKLLPEWEEATIVEILSQLEAERLVQNMLNRFKVMITDQGINHIKNVLTNRGARFCSFILSPHEKIK